MWRDVLNRAGRASGLGGGSGGLVVLPCVLLVCLGCPQAAAQEGVVVTEVLASNQGILADEDGDYSDWIEIHNAGRTPVDLAGWFLTDSTANLTRWRFPATNLIEGAFLVVFASGKDRALAGAPLHTSFSLAAAGERVLLVRPDGGTVASELAFPAQVTDISYGVAGGGPGHAFFPRPTPGALNGSGLTGWLAPPQFSVQRGFYEEAFWVTLTHSHPDAEIRYTLDGGAPGLPWPTWIALSPPDRSGRGDGVTGLRRTYDPGMTVTATAAPTSGGHVFQKWQEGGAFLSSNAAVAVTLDRPRSLEAVYAPGALAPHKVEEAAAYTLVYSLEIPLQAAFNETGVPYELDYRARAGAFRRVGYYLELQERRAEPAEYVWVSMDAFTTDVARIGVPIHPTGAFFQQPVRNMNVRSSVPEIVEGDDLAGGHLEFWAGSYNVENAAQVPGASDLVYDSGDRASPSDPPGYGSMQVHNSAAGQTLFAFNGWGVATGSAIDVGLGNAPGAHPDWTFARNASGYEVRKLQVYVLPVGAPVPAAQPQQAKGVAIGLPGDSDPAADPVEDVTALPAQTLSIVSSHPDSAVLAQGPIEIHTTSTLRAVAVKPEWHPSPVETHSYLFLPAVVRQPAEVPGYPHPVLETGLAHWMSQPVRLDYEMDPDVVEALAYRAALVPALRSIPSLSLVGKVAEILGPGGVYYGDGAAAGPESVVSMELLYPEAPARNLQANAGLRPQSYPYLKRSFRLVFRDEYGDPTLEADLLRDAPWNTGSVAQQFDRLILRAGGNRSFVTRWNPDDSCYTRDEWVRASQVAMSGHGSHGIFVHLYLNGLYWGLFNAVERPDHFFAANYFGGTEDEYFAINHDGPLSGDSARWDYLTNELQRKDLSVPAHYQELGEYLHLESFCDYLLLNWYSGMADWPQNNWYASMRTRPEPGPVRFFAWDAEDVWDNESTSGPFDCVGCEGQRGNDGAWVPAEFLRGASKDTGPTIARLFNAAKANPDFRTLLADRAFRHIRPGGALCDTNAQARWIQINEFVREAVIAESARWGDARAGLPGEEGVLRDRDGVWQREYQRILHESMPGNTARLIAALRAQGYYPGIDPPALTLPGGRIEAGSPVELLAGAGTIYYSLDGSDPRLPGGDMSAAALLYSGPIPLTTNTHLKARLRSGATWSALAEAVYEATPPAVRVTEIMFHPGAPSVTEVAAGFVDAEEFEFLELHNLGAPINLAGHEFTEGIRYVFPEIQLREGGDLVLVRNPAAFALRYGTNLPVAGPFAGSLNNAGERLRLVDVTGALVQEFTYDDAWYPPTDGSGYSLVIREPRAPLATWNDPGSWEASAAWGGSPGQANHPARESLADWQKRWFGLNNPLSALTADPDGDGWPNLVEFAHGLDPLTADLVNPISATIGQDASDQRKYLELSFRRRASAPEIAYLVEVSENLHPFGGEPGEVIETEVIPEPGSGLETIVLRILPSLDSGNTRFVRIRIQK